MLHIKKRLGILLERILCNGNLKRNKLLYHLLQWTMNYHNGIYMHQPVQYLSRIFETRHQYFCNLFTDFFIIRNYMFTSKRSVKVYKESFMHREFIESNQPFEYDSVRLLKYIKYAFKICILFCRFYEMLQSSGKLYFIYELLYYA